MLAQQMLLQELYYLRIAIQLILQFAQAMTFILITQVLYRHTAILQRSYDLIGFASGIDFGRFYAPVEAFLKNNLPRNKQVFFLYTCAMDRKGFTENLEEEARKTGSEILGAYGCRGFNTYGPWKLMGGMNRGHPNEKELAGAVRFFEGLL